MKPNTILSHYINSSGIIIVPDPLKNYIINIDSSFSQGFIASSPSLLDQLSPLPVYMRIASSVFRNNTLDFNYDNEFNDKYAYSDFLRLFNGGYSTHDGSSVSNFHYHSKFSHRKFLKSGIYNTPTVTVSVNYYVWFYDANYNLITYSNNDKSISIACSVQLVELT